MKLDEDKISSVQRPPPAPHPRLQNAEFTSRITRFWLFYNHFIILQFAHTLIYHKNFCLAWRWRLFNNNNIVSGRWEINALQRFFETMHGIVEAVIKTRRLIILNKLYKSKIIVQHIAHKSYIHRGHLQEIVSHKTHLKSRAWRRMSSCGTSSIKWNQSSCFLITSCAQQTVSYRGYFIATYGVTYIYYACNWSCTHFKTNGFLYMKSIRSPMSSFALDDI